jgi:hypothetical protein
MTHPTGPGDPPPADPGGPPPFAQPHPEGRVVDLATLDWCWMRLLSTSEGVLSSRGGRRPPSMAVGYTVDDGKVLIPIGTFSAAARLLAGTQATLGLAGHGEDGLRWVVRATGVALLSVMAADSLAACRNSHPARSSAPPGADALLLSIDRIRGYHESPLGATRA